MKSNWQAFRMVLLMTLITGVLYPLSVLFVANIAMPWKAQGSFVYKNDKIIGSKNIAQKFEDQKYFWPRPSAGDYQTLPATASNYGPTSAKLKAAIKERSLKIAETHHIQDLDLIPPELLCYSGSGLDPHISLTAANFQVERVAKARSMKKEEVEKFISMSMDKPIGKLFGSVYVNVLMLNLYLDQVKSHEQ